MMQEYTNCKLKSIDELWCRRMSLIICAYFEKFDIAYFKKIASCFKANKFLVRKIWLILK